MALLFHGPSFESSTNALAVSAIVSTLTHSFKMDSVGNFHLNVTINFGISREGRKLAVMMSETTILYSLGRKIVVHDLEHNKQRAIDVGGR